jgi:hypothetical protein
MGKGTRLAGEVAPEHAALIDDLKDQLLIVFLRRLGGSLDVPINEVDDTGGLLLAFSVSPEAGFHFELRKKQ